MGGSTEWLIFSYRQIKEGSTFSWAGSFPGKGMKRKDYLAKSSESRTKSLICKYRFIVVFKVRSLASHTFRFHLSESDQQVYKLLRIKLTRFRHFWKSKLMFYSLYLLITIANIAPFYEDNRLLTSMVLSSESFNFKFSIYCPPPPFPFFLVRCSFFYLKCMAGIQVHMIA